MKIREVLNRIKAWRAFRLAKAKVHDGMPEAEVLAILGRPDTVDGPDPEAGIDYSWEYHERLPDHIDLIVSFAKGVVCCSFTRDVRDAEDRRKFRELGRPYKP